MSKKEIRTSVHHILPSSVGGASNSANTEVIRDTTHRAIHTLFQNQMFAQQLLTMTSINEKALREDVVKWLIDTLDKRDILDPYQWYKDEVIR